MSGYTKLFSSIVTSSIWCEDHATRVVWITLLAMADKDGIVDSSVPGLARVVGMEIPELEKSLEVLMSADPYSRTKDHDGRRIEAIDGGWRLLNHAKYRAKMDREEQKEKARLRQKRHRDKDEQNVTERDSHALSRDVTPCHKTSRLSRQAEAKAEAEAFTLSTGEPVIPPCSLEEALKVCEGPGIGATPEITRKWYEDRDRRLNWEGHAGKPITDWQYDLKRFAERWRSNEAKTQPRPSQGRSGPRSGERGYRQPNLAPAQGKELIE